MTQRKNTARLWELMSKGVLVPAVSQNEEMRRLYRDLDENEMSYAIFFSELGYTLVRGREYFFLSSIDPSKVTAKMVEQRGDWLMLLDFCITFREDFNCGIQFRKSALLKRLAVDSILESKGLALIRKKSDKDTLHNEIVEYVINELLYYNFIEKTQDSESESYLVTSGINYLRDFFDSINIFNEGRP